ncbi:glycerol transporter [Bacillus glycinifermentans]|uniref:Aquaporin family protein n=1 Tax=Bacillus glycinifermentans TaxID=1664069 RepID=A0A0J6ESW0_9BACI|nr:MIP/aquaporin family protein [Bacillus glycinifermentans]ATH94857.1 aquaporin family protein [Bacillus glycinifermentans]KMM63605.1 glycerol transporter [Bacillus glycinifermentans]KRT92123.1 glycerol transporter [Bacillus glycinifermentans]MEC0486802.1 aquaporin family protein [Bacillus glycinifermentans]MEC0493913.1 aquaporin family protein [Bacillus glycinifermentans]
MTAFWGEVIGTMLLIVFGAGVCAGVNLKKSLSHQSGWIVIAFGWGLGVAMAAYAVGNISGAHLNPALTLGLAFVGDFPWEQVPAYICGQMLGAFLGAVLIFLHYLPHWKETDDQGAKLGVFSTGPAIPNTFANLFSETFGTFILVLSILTIGANKFTEGLNPLIVGFLIVAIGLSLGGTTGYAINPARDLGPRIAHFVLPIPGKGGSNWRYAWVPVFGPILGGSFAGVFYNAVFKGHMTNTFWIVSAAVAVILLGFYIYSKKQAAENSVHL